MNCFGIIHLRSQVLRSRPQVINNRLPMWSATISSKCKFALLQVQVHSILPNHIISKSLPIPIKLLN
jgi:hypothetical protein